ncbi:hypothetical protein [Sphingobacterium deserti]|uniref:Uncharacterized protein n=1 Tax=Sphingobacterium deserti TaxID=1229276 RepID=A0A0B8T2D3_9SPHI|nr:hypothetical protein [Sphingobacterium deserti]KGE15036.1 hypothetical protein DI53_1263 [Sphingobacterium deserti]
MKKLTHLLWYSFSILLIIVHASSCKKDFDSKHDGKERYTVAVKFQEFDQLIRPLRSNLRAQTNLFSNATTLRSPQSGQEGYLYYWSFNQSTLEPDIFVAGGSSITFNDGQIPETFATGWGFDTFNAGFGLTISGATEIVLKMPLSGVAQVQSFGLDISSSGTGPKAFSLSYSQDGRNYTVLSEDNQFSNTNTAHARSTFVFPLESLHLDLRRNLFLKLVPKAGFRGEASDYREATSVVKLDNIRLTGVTGLRGDAPIKALHYHIYEADSKDLVASGVYDFSERSLADFSLSLPAGDYIASYVSNESRENLMVPEAVAASSLYIGNRFSNHQARIFGVLDTFTVSGDMEREIILRRYFSQVKFEFTDAADLGKVEKLSITRRHDPEFYAPFNMSLANPILDQSEIVVYPEFVPADQSISFHQFIGEVSTPFPLTYRVNAYDAGDALLRSFEVSSAVRNNMLLIFRGALLPNNEAGANFQILFNEDWDGQEISSFD